MKKLVLNIPTLYGDHHTTAVRRILEQMKGVSDIYVSSAYHQVSLTHDPKQVTAVAIEEALAREGYESGVPEPTYASSLAERSSRQTDVVSGTSGSLVFAEQTMVRDGRPLWPCPGFDVRSPRALES